MANNGKYLTLEHRSIRLALSFASSLRLNFLSLYSCLLMTLESGAIDHDYDDDDDVWGSLILTTELPMSVGSRDRGRIRAGLITVLVTAYV